MAQKSLRKLSAGKVTILKLKNRKGYAAICFNNLTEGRTPQQAFDRLFHPLKRMGFELSGSAPKAR